MATDLITTKYWSTWTGIRTYKIKYFAGITHSGLNDYKLLMSDDQAILKNKVNSHVAKLEEKWNNIVKKKNIIRSKEEIQKEAESMTQEAQKAWKEINDILYHTLDIDDTIDWELLKDKTAFSIPSPEKELKKLLSLVPKPKEPILREAPTEPSQKDYQPHFSFLDKLIKSRKEDKIQQAQLLFEKAIEYWRSKCAEVDLSNERIKEQYHNSNLEYEKALIEVKEKNIEDIKVWEKEKSEFILIQEQTNLKVEALKELYFKIDPSAITEYCDLVLNNSQYPDSFPKSYELNYNPETKILIVEYSMPSIDQFPTLNEVKVIKGELKETYISEVQLHKYFDATMYNITLRTIHELFEADVANAIDAISFNGWVDAINKATGKRENNCILSIQAKKGEFVEIDLRHVDPKTCFKNLKGIGSSKLSGITAIQPILQISRSDKRFTSHYDVADSMDNTTNLASMDWEDFEHLIREIFGKEFSSNGGEVKVTQASRDGGVDAIAFDPDPIRGGKIVIQAKRYTNTVGISAVRDLFGTVMNEGATKGILVTTADYGPDAYEFVKGKPLTLMNGANLLYLLEKHGHQARIDIKEARENMK